MTYNPSYCPSSDHPMDLHGVRPSQRTNEDAHHVYGICAYCDRTVRARHGSYDPWEEVLHLIEEEEEPW